MRLMRCSELTVSPGTSRATRRAILRSALLSVLAPLGVEHAAQGWIAHAGDVAYAAAADQHNAVFLEVVAFAGDVGDDFALVGQADLGNLAERRVRLFRGRRIDTGANAALLRVRFHGRDLRSEEHTSELQSLMRISYAVFCLKKKKKQTRKVYIR